MPVTARLSRRFYEALGDDIANELVDWFNAVDLTYRTELRELNDLHWARMDARLEAFAAELRAMEARFDGKLRELEARTDARFDSLQSLLGRQLAETRADLVKWMFVFWAGTMLTMIGFMVAVIKLR
jgi:hypothetical protein